MMENMLNQLLIAAFILADDRLGSEIVISRRARDLLETKLEACTEFQFFLDENGYGEMFSSVLASRPMMEYLHGSAECQAIDNDIARGMW